MSKLRKALVVVGAAAVVAAPAGPAFADPNPCKGQAPGPHCRPPCGIRPVIDPGDPANGVAPTVWYEQTGC